MVTFMVIKISKCMFRLIVVGSYCIINHLFTEESQYYDILEVDKERAR